MTDSPSPGAECTGTSCTESSFEVLDLLANPIWHVGSDGSCDWVNQAWLACTGRTMEQEMGNGWAEGLHPDDREPCLASYQESFHARESFRLEYRLRHRDGSYRWIASYGTPQVDGAGHFKGYFGCCHDIHDRKLAESRLAYERQFLGAILENADSIIVACNHEGKLLIFNQMARESLVADVLDIPMESWADAYQLLDPGSGKPLPLERVPLYRALKGEKVVHQELDIINDRGQRRRALSCSCPLYGERGELLGAVVLSKDITAQREAEELRRRDYAVKRTIADILTVLLATTPLQSKAQEALQAILRSGCCLDMHDNDHVCLHLAINGGIEAMAATASVVSGQELSHFSVPIAIEGEDIGSLRISTTRPLEPFQRDCFEGVIGPLLTTVVQRSWREEKISQLSRVVEQSNTGKLITDSSGTILYANPALCRMRGYTPEEMLGAKPSMFKSGNTPDAVYRELWSCIQAGKTWTGELQNRRKDGSLAWERVTIAPIRDNEDRLVNFVADYEDLTLIKQVQEERDALMTRLSQAQKMEAIGHLANGIAHDFNNILVAILGFTELAQKEFGSKEPKLGTYLDRSLRAGLRAKDLVSQLLTFSRSRPLDAKPIAPKPVVEEVVNLLRSTIPSSLSITLTIPDDLPYVRINPIQLHQVIMNLSINARDATAGHGRLDIALREVRSIPENNCASCHKPFSGDYLLVTVRDSGTGITEQQRERIFDPFFTTKDVGKGTGLGLSVVHGIVHLHGGHVSLSIPEHGGAEFAIYLPVVLAEEDDQAAVFNPRSDPIQGRVLVIDDEDAVAEFAREVLESIGCQVTTRTDSLAAWDLFAKTPQAVDLVIVDQTMPNLTGLELCSKMLALRPQLPIILWTGFSADADENSARLLGIRRFMLKPISAAAIARAAAELLQEKERRHDPSSLSGARD